MIDSFVQLASLPDRENLVAEGWMANVEICEVSFENGKLCCLRFSDEPASVIEQALIEQAVLRLRLEYAIGADIEVDHRSYNLNTS